MILVLRPGTSSAGTEVVLRELEKRGCTGRVLETGAGAVVHVVSGRTRRARRLRDLEQVVEIVPTSGPRVRREGWRFYPYHFVNWSAFGMALLGLLVFLAGLYPTGIGAEVDYRHPPAVVAQPWYLRAPQALADLLPAPVSGLSWLLCGLLALALFFLPLLDRSRSGSRLALGLRLAAALLVTLAVALLAWKGASA